VQPISEKFRTRVAPEIELHALRWGRRDAPPLVLLHGGGANAHWWDHLAPTLARDHHVVALDFRGHGDSDRPVELEVGAFNLDLESLCEHLEHPEPVLIGHSMGAHVALDHASRHVDLRGLVLVDPSRGGAARSRRAARLALSLRRSYETREEAIDRLRFVPSALHVEEALRHHIAEHSVEREPDGRFGFKFDARWFGVPSRPPPDTSKVGCPTLVVRGEESQLLSKEGAEALRDDLVHGELIEIAGAGHHVLLDRPAVLLGAIVDWLASIPVQRA
jgi:pimeloyl-ACP methyl ester carboxylesterase